MKMTEFYETIGGNYQEALSRFKNDNMMLMFLKKYLKDPTFSSLVQAVEAHDIEASFAAAHTLKGVSGNMCFDKLLDASSALTEQLRKRDTEADPELYCMVCLEQEKIIGAIQTLD